MLWAAIGIVTAAALWWLLRPLMKSGGAEEASTGRAGHDLAIYRAQLADVDRDLERGTIPENEAEAARIEIQRRMLAASEAGNRETDSRAPGLAAAIPLALIAGFGAAGLYLVNGVPGQPAQPFASREKGDGGRAKAIARLQARQSELEAQTRKTPGDARAWAELGYVRARMGRPDAAATAYGRALDLKDPAIKRAPLLAAYGEALVEAAEGTVTPAAHRAFTRAVAADPREPRARYYLGLADIQAGKIEAGLKIWLALEAESTGNAAWLKSLRARMARIAAKNKIDLAALRKTLPAAKGPTKKDVKAAKALTPEQRAAMIASMVDGLEARLKDNPGDWQGWVRLGKSRRVMKQYDKARAAYARAAALQPDNIAVLVDYGQSMLEADPPKPGKPFAPEFVALMQQIEKRAPKNAVALWFLGLSARADGRPKAARDYWTRLLPLLPEDAPQRKQLEAQIKSLP